MENSIFRLLKHEPVTVVALGVCVCIYISIYIHICFRKPETSFSCFNGNLQGGKTSRNEIYTSLFCYCMI